MIDADSYFQQRRDAGKKMGIYHLLKITTTFSIPAYEIQFQAVDESLSMLKERADASLLRFCDGAEKLFGQDYL